MVLSVIFGTIPIPDDQEYMSIVVRTPSEWECEFFKIIFPGLHRLAMLRTKDTHPNMELHLGIAPRVWNIDPRDEPRRRPYPRANYVRESNSESSQSGSDSEMGSDTSSMDVEEDPTETTMDVDELD